MALSYVACFQLCVKKHWNLTNYLCCLNCSLFPALLSVGHSIMIPTCNIKSTAVRDNITISCNFVSSALEVFFNLLGLLHKVK